MKIDHFGQVIKKYRKLRNMIQAQLAEQWGVSVAYVQQIETGKKHIADQQTLRLLSDLLEIPLWEFGLSDYDPFDPERLPGKGIRMYRETLEVIESLIQQTLGSRSVSPVPVVEQNAQRLRSIITYFQQSLPVPAQLEAKFVSLLIQQDNLSGLMHFEHDEHKQALILYEQMYKRTKQLDDPAHIILALTKLSVNYMRFGRMPEAVEAGEVARDLSFKASKQAAAYANAYLAHIYAADKDLARFERAIGTAINLAEPIGNSYGDGTDFIHHKFSGILQLRSRGYLRLNQPNKTLGLHEELQRQISHDANLWLDHRLHLYRGRAYLMLGDVESAIGACRELFRDVKDWHSPHRLSRAYELVGQIEDAGYGDLRVVKDFAEELYDKG
ncbi:MAG TPA: helix-turn-helix transcriptional regulator [Ktedonosporobacter sp.]|nr:helix-turn-helix transcriptional regulator [Ktedonosporobacter sp.]